MKMDEVSVMTSMQPHEADYVDRWPNVVQPVKDDLIVSAQLQQQVNSDVISMQYMELEEFLLENSVPDGTGKVFIDNTNSQVPEKHYHISLEQRGLMGGGGNHPYTTDLSSGGNNNVHLLNIHNHHPQQQHDHHPQQNGLGLHQQHMQDPNSPPQSSCDSPPSSRQIHHSPRSSNNQGNNMNQLSNSSTARKSLPRRASTSSNTSSIVVTPPHTPQQPSPPNSDVSTPERVKPKRAVKRSRKESVPDDNKDEKYWKRRAKNNAAAKRSRDLRREKENHIMQRVAFLEKENRILHQEMDSIKMENEELKERLARFEMKSTTL